MCMQWCRYVSVLGQDLMPFDKLLGYMDERWQQAEEVKSEGRRRRRCHISVSEAAFDAAKASHGIQPPRTILIPPANDSIAHRLSETAGGLTQRIRAVSGSGRYSGRMSGRDEGASGSGGGGLWRGGGSPHTSRTSRGGVGGGGGQPTGHDEDVLGELPGSSGGAQAADAGRSRLSERGAGLGGAFGDLRTWAREKQRDAARAPKSVTVQVPAEEHGTTSTAPSQRLPRQSSADL